MLTKVAQFKRSIIFKDILLFSAITFLCIAILHSPNLSASGAQLGINFCLEILVPSLFPFMVLASFVVQSGLAQKIGKLFAPLVKKFFHLPGCTTATILFGLLGGYPTGAIGINELYSQKKITSTQAEQMLLFIVCGGPAFVMSAIGTQIATNQLVGVILFIAQILSAIILGVFVGFFYKNSAEPPLIAETKVIPLSSALVNSCLSAAKSMLNMCAFVVLFSAFLSIISQISFINAILNLLEFFHVPLPIINSVIPMFLEVTNGCSAAINNRASIELLAFALSWAGLCVHFQIFSITEQIKFSKTKFFLARLIHATVSTIVTHILLLTFGQQAILTAMRLIFSSPTINCYASKGSLALIILCVIFLLTTPSPALRRDNFEKAKKRSSSCFFKR